LRRDSPKSRITLISWIPPALIPIEFSQINEEDSEVKSVIIWLAPIDNASSYKSVLAIAIVRSFRIIHIGSKGSISRLLVKEDDH
jgi:hypothetical protein